MRIGPALVSAGLANRFGQWILVDGQSPLGLNWRVIDRVGKQTGATLSGGAGRTWV